LSSVVPHHTTTVLRPIFWDHPGEPAPEENFWTLWCKGRLTEADTATIRLGATPSGLTSAHLLDSPMFFYVFLSSVVVELISKYKIHGVLVVSVLKWDDYIVEITSKAGKRLWSIKQLRRAGV